MDALRQQGSDRRRHGHLPAIPIFCSAGFEPDGADGEVHLPHSQAEQLSMTPAVGVAEFEKTAHPQTGPSAGIGEAIALFRFEEAGAGVVLLQHRDIRHRLDLRRRAPHRQRERPFQDGQLLG